MSPFSEPWRSSPAEEQLSEATGYFVIVGTYREYAAAERRARSLDAPDARVIDTDRYDGLMPGWFAVVAGIHEKEESARAQVTSLKARRISSYVKKSRRREWFPRVVHAPYRPNSAQQCIGHSTADSGVRRQAVLEGTFSAR